MVSLEKQCLSLRRLLMANHFEGYEFTPFQTLYPFQYLTEPGHVNNVTYVRYAETARVNFMRNFATHLDPANKKAWINLLASTGIGLILRSIKIDYKFVRVLCLVERGLISFSLTPHSLLTSL